MLQYIRFKCIDYICIMIQFMLLFRIRQVIRYAQEVGILRTIILFVAFIIFVPRLAVELWTNNPYYLALFWGSILISIHFKRPDHNFLKRLDIQRKLLFSVEYGILSLTLIVFFIYQGFWWVGLGLALQVIALPWVPPMAIKLNVGRNKKWWDTKTLWSPLYFEWISGVRQRFLIVVTLWGLGMVFCAFAPVVPIITFLLTIIIVQFYLHCEPKEMVEVLDLSPHDFVRWKVGQTLRLFALFTLPLWIGFMVFNPAYWFALPTVWFITGLLLMLAVVLKYATYIPNEDLSQNNTLMTLAIMFTFLPPFSFLINVFWIVRYYNRAVVNMKMYLDSEQLTINS